MTPGRSAETTGASPGITAKSPSVPGTTTIATSPDSRSFSGETSSKNTLSAMGRSWSGLRGGGHLLGLFHGLFDAAHHVEGAFRQMVVLAVHHRLEGLDGFFEFAELSRTVGEHPGHVARLGRSER